jgi:four helix bundle protein
MALKSYKELIVWQKAMDLAALVYQSSVAFPKDEIYGLRQQLRRAAVLIPSNIAEGQCRTTTKDFLNFLAIARGSLAEVETQILLAARFEYFSKEQLDQLLSSVNEVGRLLSGLQNSLATSHQPLATSH